MRQQHAACDAVPDAQYAALLTRLADRAPLLFIGGEIKGRFSGARAEHWVKDFLAEHGAVQVEV